MKRYTEEDATIGDIIIDNQNDVGVVIEIHKVAGTHYPKGSVTLDIVICYFYLFDEFPNGELKTYELSGNSLSRYRNNLEPSAFVPTEANPGTRKII